MKKTEIHEKISMFLFFFIIAFIIILYFVVSWPSMNEYERRFSAIFLLLYLIITILFALRSPRPLVEDKV